MDLIVDLLLKWLVPFACSTSIAGIVWLFRLMTGMRRENMSREKAMGAGLIALLAASLMDIYHRCSTRGFTTHEERHNATRSY